MSITAILGAGVMGEALLAGLLRGRWSADDLLITDKRPERATRLRARHGVEVVDNLTAAGAAGTLVLAVKPQDMVALLREISSEVRGDALVLSIAAGITTSTIEDALPAGTAVVRAMPNTPALVDQGITAISAGAHCDLAHLELAAELMSTVGRVVQVPESQQDAVTAISGSGPAYLFYVVEAMIEAGVLLGLPRSLATELTVQTMFGAATMLRDTAEHPTVLRENVTSPAGTTVAALRELDDHRVRAAFLTAMEAARDRSRELADG
ncbi:MAG: pyrroline-5-carboxylate reductase [Candidatus Nanopelagicales bacterium]|nr:pyrroline-5-carboxylate reductase [Candidatus Nanopelagicales bacterium]